MMLLLYETAGRAARKWILTSTDCLIIFYGATKKYSTLKIWYTTLTCTTFPSDDPFGNWNFCLRVQPSTIHTTQNGHHIVTPSNFRFILRSLRSTEWTQRTSVNHFHALLCVHDGRYMAFGVSVSKCEIRLAIFVTSVQFEDFMVLTFFFSFFFSLHLSFTLTLYIRSLPSHIFWHFSSL